MIPTATSVISINSSKIGGAEVDAISRAILDETTNVCRLILRTNIGIELTLVNEETQGEDAEGSPLVVIVSAFDSIDWYYDDRARFSHDNAERWQRVATIAGNIKEALQGYLKAEHGLDWEPHIRIVLLQGAEV